MGKKYRYNVCLCAEDYTTGTIVLTKKEAELVDMVTNSSNWDDLEYESYSGSFFIDLENPIEVEDNNEKEI